jgi:hypothetical protein
MKMSPCYIWTDSSSSWCSDRDQPESPETKEDDRLEHVAGALVSCASGARSAARVVHFAAFYPLSHGPVHIAPDAVDFDVGLIDEPPVTRRVPSKAGRFSEQRREPLHPPVDGDVVDLDAAFVCLPKMSSVLVRRRAAVLGEGGAYGSCGRRGRALLAGMMWRCCFVWPI